MAKMAFLELLDSAKLISRKIWMTEKTLKNHYNLKLEFFIKIVQFFSDYTMDVKKDGKMQNFQFLWNVLIIQSNPGKIQ